MHNRAIYIFAIVLLAFNSSNFAQDTRTDSAVSIILSYTFNNIFDSLQKHHSYNNKHSKSKLAAATSTIVIQGKCYNGPGTNNPLDSGNIRFCVKPVIKNDSNETVYYDWSLSGYPMQIGHGGVFSGVIDNVQKGQNYVLINPSPYALQWWDGKNVSEQPAPVSLLDDTINCEFHFTLGGKIDGVAGVSTEHFGLPIWLVDSSGIAVLWNGCSMGFPFEITAVPNGNFYLMHPNPDLYTNMFYKNTNSIASANIFSFSQPGMIVDSLVWPISSVVSTTGPVYTTMVIRSPSSLSTGNSTCVLYVDVRRLSSESSSNDTISTDVITDQKLFLGRILNYSDSAFSSIYWYPGSFFRSLADTLIIPPNTTPSYMMPTAMIQYISGCLPQFTGNQNLTFEPILTERGKKTSLGASPIVLSSGCFNIAADTGVYSLWNVPLTYGCIRTEGWGAFGIDSLKVAGTSGIRLNNLTSPWNKYSIEGNVSCRQAPILGCFDSTGRLVSITAVDIYNFFKSKTGPRSRFFEFFNINEKPYTLSYCINFLSAGKYAIVKAEALDTIPGQYRISWYGGPENIQSFIAADDMTLLKIPSQVTWVKVDSINSLMTLSNWTGIENRMPSLRQNNKNECLYRSLHGGKIVFSFSRPQTKAIVKVLSLNGKVLDSYTVKDGFPISLNNNLLNKMVVFEVDYGNKFIMKTIVCK